MENKTIEKCDDDINVEEIMQKIQENLRRRRSVEEFSTDPEFLKRSNYCIGSSLELNDSIQRDLSILNSIGNIHNNNYFISSHHPLFGKFLVKGRQLVHGEVRRYVDPTISQQSKFNSIEIRVLNQILQKCGELEIHFSRKEEGFNQAIAHQKEEFNQAIAHQKEEFQSNIINSVDSQFRAVFSQVDSDLRSRIKLAQILENRIAKRLEQKNAELEQETKFDDNYLLFEDRFRGSREAIKQRQLSFLPYFEKCSHVLDIGCGRGEFLEILRDHKIGGMGVELDADLSEFCRSHQLNVEHSDAITYLEKLEDNSLDGIFIDQVVEHLEPKYLVMMLSLCFQKLKSGYYLVIETVNPLSFVSFVNFYIDMTHTKPVHPETLKFLIGAAGFKEIETKVSTPVSPEYRLKKIPDIAGADESSKISQSIYNENIEKLNDILYGDQDYSVIGKKI
jgi:2-polyprenyl-3-methyl-5-hydroxy-6-metoxy-1,4-benzoquinol methylase